jgi:hypothetical protein
MPSELNHHRKHPYTVDETKLQVSANTIERKIRSQSALSVDMNILKTIIFISMDISGGLLVASILRTSLKWMKTRYNNLVRRKRNRDYVAWQIGNTGHRFNLQSTGPLVTSRLRVMRWRRRVQSFTTFALKLQLSIDLTIFDVRNGRRCHDYGDAER